jgi:hypothetical protein
MRGPESTEGPAPGGSTASSVEAELPASLSFHDVRAVLSDVVEANQDGWRAMREVAGWLDRHVSRPHPDLGRSGEICPWTRRTIDLGTLELVPVASTRAAEVDGILRLLLDRFLATESTEGGDAAYRSLVAIFHRLDPESASDFMVAAHARSKPTFLERGLMLGEFYPGCEKPGLRNPQFRPLRSPFPLFVIRQMVETDIEFLFDRDEFVEAYLRAYRRRGLERLLRMVEQRPAHLEGRMDALARIAAAHRHLSTRPPSLP